MTQTALSAGREFLLREGRLLERRLFATLFEGAPAAGVVDALRGYQNDDGGFGHALEPDKRCPASLGLDVEIAFQALVAAGVTDGEMLGRACDFLASIADEHGAVALCSPAIEAYPRAEHITEWTYKPDLNPTAGLAGLLHQMDVRHPWLDRATDYCWTAIAAGPVADAHALNEALVFLEHVPDQSRARSLAPTVTEQLATTGHFRSDPGDPEYGVTPLHLAPTPDSPWRSLFSDEQIDGHLDRLERDQQADGGWPLTWEPPSVAAALEYRGMETLRALRVLRAYGRLG